MGKNGAIVIVGTFDSKGEEHLFLKKAIEGKGLPTLTINVGTGGPSPFPADLDLYRAVIKGNAALSGDRDAAIRTVLSEARRRIREFHDRGRVRGIISAGGGTGTHLGTGIMRALPMGIPKVMVSTVASRDMSVIVGTRDITMMHTVVDLLGVNSISGGVLDRAAAAVCAMARAAWRPRTRKKRIALTMFGFITKAAETVRRELEKRDYEVIAFHANGTGGTAMEELAAQGLFEGILDLATHELADELMGGYCRGIGPQRLRPVPGENPVPRLVVPGGLDCAVLEFTRDAVPDAYRDRKVFFYDFRSAVRLSEEETRFLARQLAQKLGRGAGHTKVLIPERGWSEADREGGPLYDPATGASFSAELRRELDPGIEVRAADLHINDPAFAVLAARLMDGMVRDAISP